MESENQWHHAEKLADGTFKIGERHTLSADEFERLMAITGGKWILYCLQGRPAKSPKEPWVVFQTESN